jgi:hypothetical protein
VAWALARISGRDSVVLRDSGELENGTQCKGIVCIQALRRRLRTRRFLRFDKFPPGEREKNILPDIPVRYGKPPDWRFYKNVLATT